MFITKNNEQEKDTENLKKFSKLNGKKKTMTKKLKESKRVEAQNFYLFFVICNLRKYKKINGQIFLNLKCIK